MLRSRLLPLATGLAGVALMCGVAGAPALAQVPQNGGHPVNVGGLVNVALNNTSILNQSLNNPSVLDNVLNGAINGNTVQVVYLSNDLNGNRFNALNNNPILSQNQILVQNVLNNDLNNTLNNNTVLQNFLNQNNIQVGQVVALDLLSGTPTIFVSPAVSAPAP